MKNSLSLFMLLACFQLNAQVSLPAVISDNMVLQRNSKAAIWGWAQPHEEVTVQPSWDNAVYKIKTGSEANWSLQIQTPGAGGPYSITIKGYNEIVLKNILIGEVWLCSGQSNMEMSADWKIDDGNQEIANATNPNLRLFSIPKRSDEFPQSDVKAQWTLCTPETMRAFSSVGYFFGQKLSKDLNGIPVGLIQSAWGGSPAEVWIPETAVHSNPVVREAAAMITASEWCPTLPGRTFNAMIHPVVPFEMAGVLWYQGESNTGSKVYDQTLTTLINSWRALWKKEFPFYIVQIAPFNYENNPFGAGVVRDAQRKVSQAISNSGLVVTSDISAIDELHPKNKKSVGYRLANLALANHYRVYKGEVNGPMFRNAEINDDHVVIAFDAAEGLTFRSKKSRLFELAGADSVFYPADARLAGNRILLKSAKVKNPRFVRYAFRSNDNSDLFNSANLPASTFFAIIP